MNYLIVFVGAGLGGMARHGVNVTALRLLGGHGFPFGTFTINVVGSFLMGVVVEYFAFRSGLPQHARLFLTTGILGGFTTFSAFSLETAVLIERGQILSAGLYATGSVILSVGGLFLGMTILRNTLA